MAGRCKLLQFVETSNGYYKEPFFSSDFLSLPLGYVDIVLSVHWLHTLGRILFDFKNRTIEFVHQVKKHVLRRASTQPKAAKAKELNKKVEEQTLFMLTLITIEDSKMQCNSIEAAQGTEIPSTLVSMIEQYNCIFEVQRHYPTQRTL